MADLSIIEWIAYGIPAYGSLVMLIVSMIRDIPVTRALSAIRLFCAMPGMITAALLAPAGPKVALWDQTITTVNGSSGALITNSTQSASVLLSGPSWYVFHWMIFIILFVFIIYQIFLLLIKAE